MSDLDDFFAKKDKKKKGKAKKFVGTNTASIAKVLESVSPVPTEPDKLKKDVAISLPISTAMDDVWREVEEEKEDLEGLRVRSLRAADEGLENVEKREEDRSTFPSDSDGTAESANLSPWQSVVAQQLLEPTDEVVADVPLVTIDPVPTPVKSGTYVPPNLRKVSGRGPSKMGGAGRRGMDKPPDFKSSEAFPTLGEGL